MLAGLACTWPAVFRSAGLLSAPATLGAGSAAFILFFAGVGWESMARIGPSLAGRWALVRTVLVAAAAVGAAYLSLTLLLTARSAAGGPPPTVAELIGLGTCVILLLYCAGNIGAASAFATALTARSGPGVSLAIGALAAALAVAAARASISLAVLLIAPCCAAWLGYLVATVAAIKARAVGRLAGALMCSLLFAVLLAAII